MKRMGEGAVDDNLLQQQPLLVKRRVTLTCVDQSVQEFRIETCLPCGIQHQQTSTPAIDVIIDENRLGGRQARVNHSLLEEPTFSMLVSTDDDCANHETDSDERSDSASLTPPSTGLVFEAAKLHFDRHNRLHPERPDRITNLFEVIHQDQRLNSYCRIFLPDGSWDNLQENLIDNQDFIRVHSSGYLQRLERISQCGCINRLDLEANQYNSVYLSSDTLNEAKMASRSLCHLVSRVMQGDVNNGFAIIRPPGHHAQINMAGGYCILNHVAVAASYVRAKFGLSKILIVDWDVHHGNGTQEIFYDNPHVQYISIHRWEGGNFFPFSSTSGPTHIGKDKGTGYNVNIGWSRKGMGDIEYLAAWNRLVMPLAREFDPDFILVSAGFDAAHGEMGECQVTPYCFGQMTSMLMTLAKGRLVCTLEGGYVRSILAQCVLHVLRALTGSLEDEGAISNNQQQQQHHSPETVLEESSKCSTTWSNWDDIDDSAVRCIEATATALRPYWKCLQNV